jgi:CheY-like chemotaxis protein
VTRALVVEDSSFAAAPIVLTLRAMGYHVYRVASVDGAKLACRWPSFDLYVVDVEVQRDERGGSANGFEFVA